MRLKQVPSERWRKLSGLQLVKQGSSAIQVKRFLEFRGLNSFLNALNGKSDHSCDTEYRIQSIVIYLGALFAISLLLQTTYFRLIVPHLKQSSQAGTIAHLQEAPDFVFIGDEGDYYLIAHNLSEGRGYSKSRADSVPEPTAYRPPLFPTLLATVFLIFGSAPEYGVNINQILIALLIPLSFWLGRLLCDDRCGIVAATIVAVWPHGFYMGNALLTEALFAVLILTTFVLLTKLISSPSIWLAIAAGVAAGGAALTRSGFTLTVLLLALWFIALPRNYKPFRLTLIFCGTVAITLSPWIIRNYMAMGTITVGATSGGANLAGAHSPETVSQRPGGWIQPQPNEGDVFQVAQMSEVERDSYFWRLGLEYLSQLDPQILVKLITLKLARLWIPIQRIVLDDVCLACNVGTSMLFMIPVTFSVLGLLLIRAQKAIFRLAIVYVVGVTIVSLIFDGSTRYRMPLEPIMWTFAAYGMIRLFHTGNFQKDSKESEIVSLCSL